MLTRKCDICGSEMRVTSPRYTVTFDGWLYKETKDICVACFERIKSEIRQADTPQTEPKGCCDCVHHTKEGCEYPSAYCSNWSEYKQKQTERVETMSCQEHCLWWFTDDGKDGYCQRHYHGKPCEFKPRTDCGWK